MKLFLLACALVQVVVPGLAQLKYHRVYEHLNKRFQPDVIPIEKSANQPLKVKLELNLEAILEVDEKAAELILTERHQWQDKNLAWDRKVPDMNFESVSVNVSALWMPDLAINTTVNQTRLLTPEKVRVFFNGTVRYEPRKHMRLFTYPLDSKRTKISIAYRSATYENYDLVFEQPSKDSLNLRYLQPSDFDVESIEIKKQFQNFPPSPLVFDTLTFNITLKNKH